VGMGEYVLESVGLGKYKSTSVRVPLGVPGRGGESAEYAYAADQWHCP